SCADINHIHYRMPITRKLPNLLGIHVEQQSDLVPLVDRFCLHVRHLDAAPRNRGENPHQRPLGVAIEDVKDLHGRIPVLRAIRHPYSSSKSISATAPPAATIVYTFA